jgi:hypothetical protein
MLMNQFFMKPIQGRKPMLSIKVIRYSTSYFYERDTHKPLDWLNNDAHNCEDDYIILDGTKEIFRCKTQTVSNMQGLDSPTHDSPQIRFVDTIAPGKFQMKLFVEPRSFYGRIHGICDTYTMAGDYIDLNSVSKTNPSRWLRHDDQKHRTDAQGKAVAPGTLTRVCWSAACFVAHMADLEREAKVWDDNGSKAGQYVPGELVLVTV